MTRGAMRSRRRAHASFSGVRAAVPIVPISDAFWASGGWWDLASIPGANGATFSATVAPSNVGGQGVFTPVTRSGSLPTIYDTAIGGKRGLVLAGASDNGIQNDALAPILNGSAQQWTFVVDAQANSIGGTNTTNLLAWGSDQPAFVEDFLKLQYNLTTGGATVQGVAVTQQTGGGTTATQNNVAPVLGYEYFRFAATYDGTTLKTYVNGALATVSPSTWQTAAMTITRFIWGAYPVSGVPFNGFNGYLRRIGVRQGAATSGEIGQIDANMALNDITVLSSASNCPQFLVAGASVINGAPDEINGMGVRYSLSKYIQDNRLSWGAQGPKSGAYARNGTPASSGTDSTQIVQQVATWVTAQTKMIVVDLGDQEIDEGQTSTQVLAAVASAIQEIRTAAYAVSPQCDIAVNTIIPLSDVNPGFNPVCIATNAGLPGTWDASDAAFPGNRQLIRWDANTAIGGPSYVQANYNASGDNHPNNQGYTLMGAAMLAAISARLSAVSP